MKKPKGATARRPPKKPASARARVRIAQLPTGVRGLDDILVGEYGAEETQGNPLFTIADGLFWLSQKVERNSVVRKLQILKVRGQDSVPGLHTVRISDSGLQAFSRTLGFDCRKTNPARQRRLSMGIAELDLMMGGGVLEGDSLLIAGPSGTGKTALATQFIAAGLRAGEPAIMAIFEERPKGYAARADSFGLDLNTPLAQGQLEILYLRPLDLSVDEIMLEILDAVDRIGAKRLVIDSLVSLEMALGSRSSAPSKWRIHSPVFPSATTRFRSSPTTSSGCAASRLTASCAR